jgi:hypothetical protein
MHLTSLVFALSADAADDLCQRIAGNDLRRFISNAECGILIAELKDIPGISWLPKRSI